MITRSIRGLGERFSIGVPPSTGFKEALQWLMMARLALLYLALTWLVLQNLVLKGLWQAGHSQTLVLGHALVAAGFAFNLVFSNLMDRLPSRWWIAGTHMVFDAATTCCWMLVIGGKENLFALLYLIQILVAALTFYQKGALGAAFLSSLGFGFALLVGVTKPDVGWMLWGIYSAIFLTLGLVGGFLSEELLRTTQKLKEKSKKIETLTLLHERIISNLPTGLLTVDHEMRVNFINPAGAQILNRPTQEIVGKQLAEVESELLPFFEQIETEEIRDEEEAFLAVGDAVDHKTSISAAAGELHKSYFVTEKFERRHARLQQRVEIGRGTHRRILRGDVADLDAEGGLGSLLGREAIGGRVLLFQDVTKLLHLEEKLKQHEKLAAVGQLAAGIAHEIRNPLASMSASIEMLHGAFPPGSEYAENRRLMDIAVREIDRLNRLISEFLDFVKPEKLKMVSLDLGALLSEICFSIRNSKEAKEKVEWVEKFAAKTLVLGHSEKLKQIALNLIVNAVQAMSGSGKIEVGCAQVNNQVAKFWVQDTGQGMSDEVKGHLYEPFFTTKDKGTGLGLATVYKLVEAHQGEIRVTSTVGKGTRFEIFLQSA